MKTHKGGGSDQTVCRNKKASYQFFLLETMECGIALLGTEVKSLRDKAASIEEAFVRIDGGQLWLVGMHISPYDHGTTNVHEPTRKRKLLVHRLEIRRLQPKIDQKGLTLVPTKVYFNDRGIAKVSVALAKGKSVGDKRQSLKARDDKREMDRAMHQKSWKGS